MKFFLSLFFLTVSTSAWGEISRQCYNDTSVLEVYTVSDSDGNEAVVLEILDKEGRTQRLVSNGVEGHDFAFYAVFEGFSSELTGGTLTESKLLVVIGSQARLAEECVVHHFQCS